MPTSMTMHKGPDMTLATSISATNINVNRVTLASHATQMS